VVVGVVFSGSEVGSCSACAISCSESHAVISREEIALEIKAENR
jgi:tmRNA-binding protein